MRHSLFWPFVTQYVPWVPKVFSRVHRGASFYRSAAGRQVFGQRTKKRTGHFLRLDRNRKPRMKSLWHPGYTICGWEHICYMQDIRTNKECTGRSLASGRRTRDSLHVRCLRPERTHGAEQDFERETAFPQASRRWKGLVRYLTVHDHRMNVEYVINVMEK